MYVKDLSALLEYVIKSSDRSDKADSRTAVAEIGRVLKNVSFWKNFGKFNTRIRSSLLKCRCKQKLAAAFKVNVGVEVEW
jgi:hypothetical protein